MDAEMEAAERARKAESESERRLDFVERFIWKHYRRQSPFVRSFTFVVFVLLFAYGFYRMVGGQFTVTGRIFINEDGGLLAAKNFDILLGDKEFGPNSKGLYYITLSPWQYYRLVLEREITLGVVNSEGYFSRVTKAYAVFGGEVTDIVVSLSGAVGLQDEAPQSAHRPAVLSHRVWAGQTAAGTRLFIQAIQLPSGLAVKLGTLEFIHNGTSLRLLSARSRGGEAGAIPLASGATVALGLDPYFNMPSTPPLSLSGVINLSAKTGLLSSYKEAFRVSMSREYAQTKVLAGNRGGRLTLVLLLPFDVVIYQKRDIAPVREAVIAQLSRDGFRVIETSSPLGFEGQTNAIFSGKLVSFTAIQEVIQAAIKHRIPIKTIQHRLDLRSGNPYEIQLGGSAAFNSLQPIPEPRLRRLLGATSEAEFSRLLSQ